MDFNPYDLNKLQEIFVNNRDFIESFFGKNTFDEKFFKRVIDSENIVGNVSDIKKEANHSNHNSKNDIPMDMIQKSNELFFIFELPGLTSKEDVNIKIYSSTLIIEGNIKRPYGYSGRDITKFERKIGNFYKKVHIPIVYDSKRIRAKYNNGLLEIRIPILKQNDQERINIHFQSDE